MKFGFIIPSGPDKNGRKATHPQEQVRQNWRIAYAGKKAYTRPYGNAAVNDAKELVAQYTMVAMRKHDIRKPTSEPLEITTAFFFTKPKSRQRVNSDPFPFPGVPPDKDNLEKLVLDGMQNVLYTSDALVIQGGVYKRYTHRDAYTVVGVRSLEDNEAMPPWDVYPHLAWMKPFCYNDW